MTTDNLRELYGQPVSRCVYDRDGVNGMSDDAFTDDYVLWLENKLMTMLDNFNNVNRIEIIDWNGRVASKWDNDMKVTALLQDGNKTLKLVCSKNINPRYTHIASKEKYSKLLESGMFFEFHPELSGDWEKDQSIIHKIQ